MSSGHKQDPLQQQQSSSASHAVSPKASGTPTKQSRASYAAGARSPSSSPHSAGATSPTASSSGRAYRAGETGPSPAASPDRGHVSHTGKRLPSSSSLSSSDASPYFASTFASTDAAAGGASALTSTASSSSLAGLGLGTPGDDLEEGGGGSGGGPADSVVVVHHPGDRDQDGVAYDETHLDEGSSRMIISSDASATADNGLEGGMELILDEEEPVLDGGSGEEPPRLTAAQKKQVKVYELRNEVWNDRGTGNVHGLYVEASDEALLVVTAEPLSPEEQAAREEETGELGGGFVVDDDALAGLSPSDRETIAAVRSKGVEGKILMNSHIQGKDVYQKQQDTLIVWTEPDGTDIALSFANPEGCESIWGFILEVQKMLDNGHEEEIYAASSSSPPMARFRSATPPNVRRIREKARTLIRPGLGKLQAATDQVKSLSRTILGRERLVEAVVKEDYLKIMLDTFEQAEDLESISDLHALFTLMQTILLVNDTSVLEYVLQDDLFLGVVGMLEYDPEFPRLKASYRDFLTGTSRFREAVEIKDPSIQMKIHQTYRLAYLKDVVLARILEDSTTNMLNSLIYFNQNDIVQHMQANTELLIDVFAAFQPAATLTAPLPRPAGEGIHFVSDRATTEESEVPPPPPPPSAMPSSVVDSPELEAHKKDVVLLLHQLLIMSKNIALTSRLHLVRTLLEHGLVHVLEWAFSTCTAHATTTLPPSLSSSSSSFSLHPPPPSPPPLDDQIPNAAVEMLTHALDHDLQAVRSIVLKEHEAIQSAGEELSEEGGGADAAGGDGAGNHGTTLVVEMIRLLVGKEGGPSRAPPGLRSQLADALKQLLDTGDPDATSTFTRGPVKDGPIAESFISYFYDHCVLSLMKPLLDLPEFKTLKDRTLELSPTESSLLLSLCDLLSFFCANHGHRSQYFILSGTLNTKIGSLLRARDKPLRHAVIRFYRACLRVNNHFMFRYLNKGDVFAPVLDLVSAESAKDNMLSSACLELFEYIRRENLRVILDHLMDHHGDRIRLIATRPVLTACFQGVIQRWEQNNEPPPAPDVKKIEEDTKRQFEKDEDDYFLDDDDDDDDQPAGPASAGMDDPEGGGLRPSAFNSSTTADSFPPCEFPSFAFPPSEGESAGAGFTFTPSSSSSLPSIPSTRSSLNVASLGPAPSKRKRLKSTSAGDESPGKKAKLEASPRSSIGLDLDYVDDDEEEAEEADEPLIGPVPPAPSEGGEANTEDGGGDGGGGGGDGVPLAPTPTATAAGSFSKTDETTSSSDEGDGNGSASSSSNNTSGLASVLGKMSEFAKRKSREEEDDDGGAPSGGLLSLMGLKRAGSTGGGSSAAGGRGHKRSGSLHSTGDGNAVRTAGPSTTAATDEKAAGEDKPKRVGFKFGLKKKGADGKSIFEP